MMTSTAIDLSKLPPPEVVETLDYEAILRAMLDDLRLRDPSFTALVESDPAYKLLEIAAYRELLLRQRVNDAARGVMLARATGADLDQLAALFGVERQLLAPGDTGAVPPRPPFAEDDDRLRRRVQLALEGTSTAGPAGSYLFHTLNASPDVKDADASSPEPGEVEVRVLSRQGDGTADTALLDRVAAALNDEDVRPLTDHVSVRSAEVVTYTLTATLELRSGPGAEAVRQSAEGAARRFVDDNHRLGRGVSLSGLYAALHGDGVERVILESPTADVAGAFGQAAYCSAIVIRIGGQDA